MKKVVFTFGRMNPPTIGHEKLVKKVQDVAKSTGSDARVYLSHTQNDKKDPLNYVDKIRYARKAFGNVVVQSPSKTIFQIMSELEKSGYTDVIMVVGSDRVPEFKKLLEKYNGKDYNFDSIAVVSAGARDPDATGVEGMSASKLRAVAKEGDFETFKTGLPKKLNDRDAKAIFDTINKVIKEDVDLEERAPLTIAQRQKMARQMKRLAPRLARFRKIKAKRKADKDVLMKRAQKAARNIIRKKVAGDRGANYSALSASEKITIDKLVAKKSAVIQRLAKKLLPTVRKSEMERLKKARSANEEFDVNELFEEVIMERQVPEDPDIKDREGSQPRKYHTGLEKSTKKKRDTAFKKGAKKDSDDPSAYPDKHPGDAGAKTKTSKHTKKYRQMFGEGEATKRAKEAIKREKEADKEKFDNLLDRARTQDTRAKNRQTEEFELTEDSKAALQKKADKSGIPYSILKKVYDRGMAAWRTGHRPGATQQQWAYARVNSFITGGKTRTTGDADLWKQAKAAKSKKEEVAVEDKGPCWDGYKQVGMKKGKDGKPVPNCVKEAVSPAQQAAIAISKKERGEKPKNEEQFEPHMMYDPKSDDKELAKVPADHERLAKKGWTHEPPKKKKLKAMLGVPMARPTSQFGEEAELEEMPRWLKEPLSKITRRKGYEAAKKVLADVLARKKKEGGKKGLPHTIEYYAGQIARQFDGVDARVLADMVNETPEKMDAPQIGTDKIKKRYSDMTPGQISESFQTPKSAGTGHTMFATEFLKVQGAYAHHPDVEEELERRAQVEEDYLGWTIEEGTLEEAEYQGRKVKLRDPFRTPKGPKKFSVYVKNDKGNVIKVNFGDPNMEIKRDDPGSRKNFRARHNCDDKTDDTTAGYWSCKMWQKGKTVSDLD